MCVCVCVCLTVCLFLYLNADSSLLHGGSLGMASVNDTISCSSLTFAASYSRQAGTESELFSRLPIHHSDNNTSSSSNHIILCCNGSTSQPLTDPTSCWYAIKLDCS